MKTIFLIAVSLTLLIAHSHSQHSKIVQIPELVGNQTYTIIGDYDDVDKVVNQVWYTYQPVELIVRSFKIDIQSGDFVLLSKYGLEWDHAANKPKLPVREYSLLVISDDHVNEFNTTVQMINPDGVSVYFHGFKKKFRGEFQEGFMIEVGLIDKTEPDPPTTTENIIPTPDPEGEDSYNVTKFIVGKHPNRFLAELNEFKRNLAKMTNAYCESKGISLVDDASEHDVRVPTSFLRYCDRSWPPYDTCVEATFAVAVYDSRSKAYVMNAPRLDDMWRIYAADYGYTDYLPPDGNEISQPALWLTVFLGFILVVLPLLCILWLKKWSDEYQRDSGVFDAVSTMNDGTEGPVTFFDRENPVYKAPKRRDLEGFDNIGFDNAPVYRQNSPLEQFDGHLRGEGRERAEQEQHSDEDEVQYSASQRSRRESPPHFVNDDNGNGNGSGSGPTADSFQHGEDSQFF